MSPETARLLDKLSEYGVTNVLLNEVSAALLYADRLKYELKLTYGLLYWDNADAALGNIESILTWEEIEEGRALADSDYDDLDEVEGGEFER